MSEKIQFEFMIDDKSIKNEFKKVETEGKKAAKKIGDDFKEEGGGKGGGGLFQGISFGIIGLNQALELAGKAIEKVKQAFNLAIDAIKHSEAVDQAAQQFELLSVRAGIASSALEDGLQKAAAGLVDSSDLIQIANKALLELGSSAEKLPELLEIARKSSIVFGGDIKDNFESISMAVSTGNTKMLKNLGIIIDQEAALKKYAESLGTTSDKLSLAGRQQALLNAILEKGKSSFEGVDDGLLKTSNSFTRFEVQLNETGETLQHIFSNIFSGVAKSVADTGTSVLEEFNKSFSNKIEDRILDLQDKVARAQEVASGKILASISVREHAKQNLIEYSKELQNLIDVQKLQSEDQLKAARMLGKEGPSLIEAEDPQKIAQNRAQLEQDLLASQERILQFKIQQTDKIKDEELRQLEIKRLAKEQEYLVEEQHKQKIQALNTQFDTNDMISLQMKTELEKQLAIEKGDALLKINQDANKKIQDMQSKHIIDLNSTLRSGISNAMQGVGAALAKGQDGWEAFKSGVLGILGDMLIRVGESVIAQAGAIEALKLAFASMTGGMAFVAGAALIALGGALKSQAGASLSAAASGQDSGGASMPDITSQPTEEEQLRETKTNVQVVVNGDVFDSEETSMRLAKLLEQGSFNQGLVYRGMA